MTTGISKTGTVALTNVLKSLVATEVARSPLARTVRLAQLTVAATMKNVVSRASVVRARSVATKSVTRLKVRPVNHAGRIAGAGAAKLASMRCACSLPVTTSLAATMGAKEAAGPAKEDLVVWPGNASHWKDAAMVSVR